MSMNHLECGCNASSIPDRLLEISRMLHTQDNRITDQPMFIVQKKVKDYGYDPDYGEETVWVDGEGIEAEGKEFEQLEEYWDEHLEEPDGWTRTACVVRWEFVTACFTEQSCKDYLKINKHNLRETRIYAEGSYRNQEFRDIRNYLLSLIEGE